MPEPKRRDRISFGELTRALRRDYDAAHAPVNGEEPSCVLTFKLTAPVALFTPESGPDDVELDFDEAKQPANVEFVLEPSAPLLARLAASAKVVEQRRLAEWAEELQEMASRKDTP